MNRSTALAIAWTVVILILCWTPPSQLPVAEKGPSWIHVIHLDKVVHVLMFAGYSWFWRAARPGKTVVVVGVTGVLLAIVTELGQATELVGRDASWDDGIADCLGVILGLWVWKAWVLCYGSRNGRQNLAGRGLELSGAAEGHAQ